MKTSSFLLLFLLSVAALTSKPTIELQDGNFFYPAYSKNIRTIDRPQFTLSTKSNCAPICIFTDKCLQRVKKSRHKTKIAWLVEPRAVHPNAYTFIEKNARFFDRILTFDKEILDKFPNQARFVHAVGSATLFKEKIYPKSKICSFVLSRKKNTTGHKLRWEIYEKYRDKMDIKDPHGPHAHSLDAWRNDYRYMVIVENSRKPHYFSEKILDCILAGTVPIYWGPKTIGEFFNLDGIITFDKPSELDKILESLSEEDYEKRLPAIEENFQTALKNYPRVYADLNTAKPTTFDSIWPHIQPFLR